MPVKRIVCTRRERSPSMRTRIVSPSATKVVRAVQNSHVGPGVPGAHGPREEAPAAAGSAVRPARASTRTRRRRVTCRESAAGARNLRWAARRAAALPPAAPLAPRPPPPARSAGRPMTPPPPSIAELRRVAQPPGLLARNSGEHWAGRLYMRRLSPHVTRLLVATPISANGVPWLMVVAGLLAAGSPGLGGDRGPPGAARARLPPRQPRHRGT